MRSMMRTHLDQTLSEAQNRLTRHDAADIRDHDAGSQTVAGHLGAASSPGR